MNDINDKNSVFHVYEISLFQHLTASTGTVYNEDVDRRRCDFVVDPSVHPLFSTTNEDYWSVPCEY